MIVPGVTYSPSKRFTPSRLLLLSRPFLVLPRPFLCAIAYPLRDRLDDEPRDCLPVTEGPPVAHLVLVLHEAELLALAVLGDARPQGGARNRRLAHFDVHPVDQQQHVEVDRIAGLAVEAAHIELLPFREHELMSAGSHDRLHWVLHLLPF